jgi:hypothetical protein
MLMQGGDGGGFGSFTVTKRKPLQSHSRYHSNAPASPRLGEAHNKAVLPCGESWVNQLTRHPEWSACTKSKDLAISTAKLVYMSVGTYPSQMFRLR